MTEKLAVGPLLKSSKLDAFNSGKPVLDDWLKKYAWQNQAGDTAKTYIVEKDGRVVGYYSLAAASIKVEESTARIARGQPPHRPVPVIKLARLAVDERMQGQGLGKALLKDALLRCIAAADEIAARAVVVDALDDDVRKFYLKYGFESGPDKENTLMILMKDLRKAYEES
ncbi:MAG: GNAT family N-acetyltransferase [Alphaproteobacteria bacterium]|nr:GNAT family N-acetyltransferase [Alphaproteobacteria bacterium]QQS56812.1 MAG: GNAT family N-acetyltransferase [Alphaproteobacteria bacterium]